MLVEIAYVPDSTVCSYAVDINGEMVEAAICDKSEARKAFEQEIFEQKIIHATRTNQVIAPQQATILEQVQGNFFKTRIYPVPARGKRTVRVGITFSPCLNSLRLFTLLKEETKRNTATTLV